MNIRATTRVLAFLSMSLALACGGADDAALTIKIVSSLPMQGSARAQTQTIINGIQMAVDEINGEIDGVRIVYEPWDDASAQRGNWDPVVEAANAARAVEEGAVMVYIGTYNSGAASVSMPTLNEAGVLMISPANTYVGLTKPGLGEANEPAMYRPSGRINYFRVVPADDIQGAVGAAFARSESITSAFVLDDGELYGRGIADVFQRECERLGITVHGRDRIDATSANYRALAGRIRDSGAGIVYFGGTTQSNAGQLARDLRAEGVTAPLMVPDGCYEQAFIDAAGADTLNDNTWVTFGGTPPDRLTGAAGEFRTRYIAQFHSEPEGYAVYGYEAAKVAIECIRRAGANPTRESVLEACRTLGTFEGTLGTWHFDENGDTSLTTMSISRVTGGAFEFHRSMSSNEE